MLNIVRNILANKNSKTAEVIIEITSDNILFNIVVFSKKNTIKGQSIKFTKIEYGEGTKKVSKIAIIPYVTTYIILDFFEL